MAEFELQTEIAAVNRMLASIGERPINSLSDTERLDVANAIEVLHDESRLLQLQGWWFNREQEITLTPNDDGELVVPADATKVRYHERFDKTTEVFTQRGVKLYSLDRRTTVGWVNPILVDWIKLLAFEDLPETARVYITRRSGVTFQNNSPGSAQLFEFTERDALVAFGTLKLEDLDQGALTIQNSPDQLRVTARREPRG